MKYPIGTATVIDVTQPPYCADATGRTDCTEILRRVLDDVLAREIDGVLATEKRLTAERLDLEEYYIGFENRRWKNGYNVIFPEFVPDARIIYFPAGTYLVSNTVTYTLKNLQNRYCSEPFYELTRGIRMMGEDRDTTVIRLADHSIGFEAGKEKAVVSYTTAPFACEKECSNVSQLNVFSDITVDCGDGNEGAVALRFVSNNSGCVENVRLCAQNARIGLQLPVSTEGVFRNLEISGFDYGVFTSPSTSICVFDGIRFEHIKNACVYSTKATANIFRSIQPNGTPMLQLGDAIGKQFVFGGAPTVNGETYQNLIYTFDQSEDLPLPCYEFTKDKVAFVDDFGAIGDGKTDSTGAIQHALSSGKSYVLFGAGHYLINGKIHVPATVKLIDFMYCDLISGAQLISGELDSLFVIDGESEKLLTVRNLYAFEQFYGNFRLIKQTAKRDMYLKNLHTQTAAMYFNTVGESKLYFNNCACTTGTYSMDTILERVEYAPVFSEMIPYEFHIQSVVAYQLNPERADEEILNDGSELKLYGFKVEGPGTAVRTINHGRTEIYGFSAGIGNAKAENALFFDDATSETRLFGGIAFLDYQCIYEKNGQRYMAEHIDPLHFDIENGKLIRMI